MRESASEHLSADQVKQENSRIRIKDEACLHNDLPEEICRICLATDVKMYSLKSGELKRYIDSMPGFTENLITDGMPDCVCYECAVQLKKCGLMMKKSMESKKILLDVFTQHGYINKSLLNTNKEYLQLKPLLSVHEITPMRLYHFKYDDTQNVSIITNNEFIGKVEKKNDEMQYIPATWLNVPVTFENYSLNEEVILKMETDSEVKNLDSNWELNNDELNNDDYEQEEAIYVVEVEDEDDDVTNPVYMVTESNAVIHCGVAEIPKMLKRSLKTAKKRNELADSDYDYNCEQCNFGFPTEEALRVHLFTSPKHKEFKRKYMDMQNTRRNRGRDLKGHKSNGKANYKMKLLAGYPRTCKHCDEVVQTRYHHYWHMRRKHPEQRYETFAAIICEVCGKRYKSEAILRNHMLRHSSPKCKCPLCGKLFYDKTMLNIHMSGVHSEERPYVCPQCDKSFKTRCNYTRHVKLHTAESEECSLCGKQFKNEASLKYHFSTVHLKIVYPSIVNRKRTRKPTQKRTRVTKIDV